MGKILYGTSGHSRWHSSPNCKMLNDNRTYPVIEITLETTNNHRLCQICFPDQFEGGKGLTTAHVRCKICRQPSPKPCQHNGGVLVIAPQRIRQARFPGDPEGIRYTKRRVWPENVYRYSLVEPIV